MGERKEIKILIHASVAKIVKAVACKAKDRGSETHQGLLWKIICDSDQSMLETWWT